jgi:hypothetical protein
MYMECSEPHGYHLWDKVFQGESQRRGRAVERLETANPPHQDFADGDGAAGK